MVTLPPWRGGIGMTLAFKASFVVEGLALLVVSIAVLVNFRGLGTRWDDDVYSHSKEFIRWTRMPWVANPIESKVWRPYAAIFGIVLGVVLVLIGLFAR